MAILKYAYRECSAHYFIMKTTTEGRRIYFDYHFRGSFHDCLAPVLCACDNAEYYGGEGLVMWILKQRYVATKQRMRKKPEKDTSSKNRSPTRSYTSRSLYYFSPIKGRAHGWLGFITAMLGIRLFWQERFQ